MASAPIWKVYTKDGDYIASVKHPMFGAMICAGMGQEGTTIRWGHAKVVWTEGIDGRAAESYDAVADLCHRRA
jgi:hypothetical protein